MELIDLLFALPFLFAALLGLGFMLVTALSFRNSNIGVRVAAGTFVVDALIMGDVGLRLGIAIHLPDVTIGTLAAVAMLRFVMLREARPRSTAFYLVVLVFALNLVHGLVVFKSAAGPSARPAFYALAACGYLLTFPMTPARLRGVFNALVWAGLLLILLAGYRALITLLDVRELMPPGGSFQPAGHSKWRTITSGDTLVVAEAMLSLWAFHLLAPAWAGWRFLAPLLLLAVVALQHRSVWLALVSGYMGLQMGQARRLLDSRKLLPMLALSAVLGLALMLATRATDEGRGLAADVVKSARDAAALRGTADERLGSWRQLVEKWASSGPRTLLVGQPFGTVYERFTQDEKQRRRITYQPHNYYVELLVSQGVVGLLAYLGMFAGALRGLWRLRADPEVGMGARWLMVMLSFQMTYYLTYGVDYVQGLLLGAALSLSAARAVAGSAPLRAGAWRHPRLYGRAG
jgi:O-Antigen ligase